jgi:hypothetical protein
MTTAENIDVIRRFPAQLEALITGLTAEELTTAYNAPEWTVAQNVHHLVDSHMNSYVRMKLMQTETNPTLKPYDQDVWAKQPDAESADLGPSLAILRGLHHRWANFLEGVEDWSRPGYHAANGPVTLESQLGYYVAHCQGHLDQIQAVIDKMPK